MCGGVRFNYHDQLESALEETYGIEQTTRMRESGIVQTVFWQPRPVLPVVLGDTLRLLDWGNRDAKQKLPKTGWIREESLNTGKWDHLRPIPIQIPAFQGLEKRVWFGITHGICGYIVQHSGIERVYMLTRAPTPQYTTLTGHDRMPALIEQTTITPLPTQEGARLGG